ncbi:hypothetical protein DB347_19325 [Opitutaceae bacterium EW11]|nr:hypothetical protein DB347_19325 [Opitutaceae bacterium EW11]
MIQASDSALKRLTSVAYLSLGAVVFLGTVFIPRFHFFSQAGLVFCAGLAIYVLLWFCQGLVANRTIAAALFVVAHLVLFVVFNLAGVPADYLYLLAMPIVSHASAHLRWHGTTIVVATYLVAMAWFFQGGKPTLQHTVSLTASMLAAFLFVILFTRLVIVSMASRDRAEQLAKELETANAQLREQSAQTAALAAANERNRIARDIHDGLGHYLTVIAVQLEAAGALLPADPVRARDAVAKAETLSRQALDEVRRSVGALRAAASTGGLAAALQGLVQELGAPGSLSIRGTPREVPAPVEQALFRVAQEGLTNARKHAAATCVEVVLQFDERGRTTVEINDNGRGSAATPSQPGFGLVGLRERLATVGGSLSAGNRAEGGYSLKAEVPA